jgi:ATP synthase subunit 6
VFLLFSKNITRHLCSKLHIWFAVFLFVSILFTKELDGTFFCSPTEQFKFIGVSLELIFDYLYDFVLLLEQNTFTFWEESFSSDVNNSEVLSGSSEINNEVNSFSIASILTPGSILVESLSGTSIMEEVLYYSFYTKPEFTVSSLLNLYLLEDSSPMFWAYNVPSAFYSIIGFAMVLCLDTHIRVITGSFVFSYLLLPIFSFIYFLCSKDFGILVDFYHFFFYALFINIFISNVGGLIPGAVCLTVNFSFAFFLSYIVWILSVTIGTDKEGLYFFGHFYLKERLLLGSFLSVVEIISCMVRMLTLSIRLFANISAGHLLLETTVERLELIMHIPFDVKTDIYTIVYVIVLYVCICGGLFFYESCVCFLQAYIFTLLSISYIKESIFFVAHILKRNIANVPLDEWYRNYLLTDLNTVYTFICKQDLTHMWDTGLEEKMFIRRVSSGDSSNQRLTISLEHGVGGENGLSTRPSIFTSKVYLFPFLLEYGGNFSNGVSTKK